MGDNTEELYIKKLISKLPDNVPFKTVFYDDEFIYVCMREYELKRIIKASTKENHDFDDLWVFLNEEATLKRSFVLKKKSNSPKQIEFRFDKSLLKTFVDLVKTLMVLSPTFNRKLLSEKPEGFFYIRPNCSNPL